MQFLKLSPLQSRFAVSFGATLLLILIYFSIAHPSFAYATETQDHEGTVGHDYWILHQDNELGPQFDDAEHDGEEYVSAGLIQVRAADGVSSLFNNDPQNRNIESGVTDSWVFTKEQIDGPHGVLGTGLPSDATVTGNMSDDGSARKELKKRQSSQPIWITVNTCLQPVSNSIADRIPPQLQFYYSISGDNEKPNATNGGRSVDMEGGYAVLAIDAGDDVYVSLSAPSVDDFTGSWNYEIAASIDAPYHYWSNKSDLLFVDGDNHAALLVTPDLYSNDTSSVFQEWMNLVPAPYGMFAHDQRNRSILGVSRSYCGLLHNAKIAANIPTTSNNNVGTMTNRGIGSAPKEQFYLSALNASSSYYGWLTMSGNSTARGAGVIGGGGSVWSNMTFRTKSSDNCALMYNLTFCSEVAYAVPSNPETYSPLNGLSDLSAVYDNYAQSMYQNFNYSLQQIPCHTSDTAQYSLARNCTHCAAAYKQWLCAVTIPRCEDWDNTADYLQPRLLSSNFANGSTPNWVTDLSSPQQRDLASLQANSSRNIQIIDDIIRPGPYKEVLPCIDLCYDLVQSCPAALGFGCPEGKYQNMSYGVRDPNPGIMRCSYLGAAYYLNAGVRLRGLGGGGIVMGMGWMGLVVMFLLLAF